MQAVLPPPAAPGNPDTDRQKRPGDNNVRSGIFDMAWFDPRKLERALYNLLLNACEASPATRGRVRVTIGRSGASVTIAVADNGPGIAEPIREKLFHPL